MPSRLDDELLRDLDQRLVRDAALLRPQLPERCRAQILERIVKSDSNVVSHRSPLRAQLAAVAALAACLALTALLSPERAPVAEAPQFAGARPSFSVDVDRAVTRPLANEGRAALDDLTAMAKNLSSRLPAPLKARVVRVARGG